MATASYAGRNAGQMNPPSCDAAKSTPPLPATSMRCAAESLVHVIGAPLRSPSRSASLLTETGNARRVPGRCSHTSFTSASSACSAESATPWSSMIVAVSPSGSKT